MRLMRSIDEFWDFIPKWLQLNWWKYVFKEHEGIKNIICRMKGHASVVWFNPNGLEPDMRCKHCGEDLG